MTKTVLALLAPGSEEMELVISIDVLRRAGITVTVAGLDNDAPTKCSRDVVIVPDTALDSIKSSTFDAILLPGGLGGADALSKSSTLKDMLEKQEKEGRFIAAICAAPLILLANSIGVGRSITSYPSVKDKLVEKYKYIDDQLVVHDGQFITSRGPGTAMIFALKLTEILMGDAKAKQVAKGMLLNDDYKL